MVVQALNEEKLNELIERVIEERLRTYRIRLRQEMTYEMFEGEIEALAERLVERKVAAYQEQIKRFQEVITKQEDELERLRKLLPKQPPKEEKITVVYSDVTEA
jgi:phage shock protein A